MYRGGITEETLQILVQGDTGAPQPDGIPGNNVLLDGEADYLPNSSKTLGLTGHSGNTYNSCAGQNLVWPPKERGSPHSKTKSGFYGRQYSFGRDDNSHPSELDREDNSRGPQRQQYARAEQRTLIAQNLPERTTQKDLVQVVRGGTVLDIFLRSNERSASISFVEGSAAQDFMNYVKRSDIYIRGKRVSLYIFKMISH